MPRRRRVETTTDIKDTNALTGQCASIGAEHHKKCPYIINFSWGGVNTCPCNCHKKGKKSV